MDTDKWRALVAKWRERSDDDTRRIGKRTVYGACAAELEEALAHGAVPVATAEQRFLEDVLSHLNYEHPVPHDEELWAAKTLIESRLNALTKAVPSGPAPAPAYCAQGEQIMSGEFARRADYDPTVMAAFREGLRQADDIYVVYCSDCFAWSYWNQGSHCNCRFCLADLDDEEAITMADYWADAAYPCDEPKQAPATAKEEK